MITTSARFTAGHFFRKPVPWAIMAAALAGCGGEDAVETGGSLLPEAAGFNVLIEFTGPSRTLTVPEGFAGMEGTAWGRFQVLDQPPCDPLDEMIRSADEAGMLILAVIPEEMKFLGTRDHLLVRTGPEGLPVRTEPEMGSSFLEDSLWTDPMVRQETVRALADFFKPDIVFISMEAPGDIEAVAAYWRDSGYTAGLYSQPDPSGYRGWAAVTGPGVNSTVIEGMTQRDFVATMMLTAGLRWQDTGYPAMQAFTRTEAP